MDIPRKRMIIEGAARDIILKVHTYFESEKDQCKQLLKRLNALTQGDNTVAVPLKLFIDVSNYLKCSAQVSKRTTAATHVHKNTLTRIKKEGAIVKANNTNFSTPVKRPRGKKKYFTKVEYDKLKEIVRKNFIHKNQHSNYMKLKSILSIAQRELKYQGSMATLRRIMWGMGFRWERQHGTMQVNVVEKPELSEIDESILINTEMNMQDDQLEVIDNMEGTELEIQENHQYIPSTDNIEILDTDTENCRLDQLNTDSTLQERPKAEESFVGESEYLEEIEDYIFTSVPAE